ncbi:MAG: hypothetical protein KQA40_00445 [Candidatus Aenigmarchaeota archaeon]|nr:hypothetical protein [Candidatus Aenigmarchaeota archaeon]
MNKGQIITVEYVLFFSIGIIIVISVYFLLNQINNNIYLEIINLQLEKIGETIKLLIIQVYETANNTNTNISYTLKIPPTISGSYYRIETSTNMLNLILINNNINKQFILYNISFDPTIIYSTAGEIKIFSDGTKIKLS